MSAKLKMANVRSRTSVLTLDLCSVYLSTALLYFLSNDSARLALGRCTNQRNLRLLRVVYLCISSNGINYVQRATSIDLLATQLTSHILSIKRLWHQHQSIHNGFCFCYFLLFHFSISFQFFVCFISCSLDCVACRSVGHRDLWWHLQCTVTVLGISETREISFPIMRKIPCNTIHQRSICNVLKCARTLYICYPNKSSLYNKHRTIIQQIIFMKNINQSHNIRDDDDEKECAQSMSGPLATETLFANHSPKT